MKTLITKILLSKAARNASTLSVLAASLVTVGIPWGDV